MKDSGKAQCLPRASQKNVLLGMRWAPKHGNRVTHKELRAASTFLFLLYWYSPSLADGTGKVQVFLLKHEVDVHTVSFLAAAQLYQPGSAHSLPAEAPQKKKKVYFFKY